MHHTHVQQRHGFKKIVEAHDWLDLTVPPRHSDKLPLTQAVLHQILAESGDKRLHSVTRS